LYDALNAAGDERHSGETIIKTAASLPAVAQPRKHPFRPEDSVTGRGGLLPDAPLKFGAHEPEAQVVMPVVQLCVPVTAPVRRTGPHRRVVP